MFRNFFYILRVLHFIIRPDHENSAGKKFEFFDENAVGLPKRMLLVIRKHLYFVSTR